MHANLGLSISFPKKVILRTLVSATFDACNKKDERYDVTRHIERILRAHGGGWLEMKTPPPVLDGRGQRARHQPATFRYWYTRIFGDPCPTESKNLVIVTREKETGKLEEHSFLENIAVRMRLHLSSERA